MYKGDGINMTVSAKEVMRLRKITGIGMMECKKALVEAEADMDKAVEILRTRQGVKADKKQGRVTAEGVVMAQVSADGTQAVMMEVNCETDFVSRDKNFLDFTNVLVSQAMSQNFSKSSDLLSSSLAGSDKTLEEERKELIAKIGENIQLRRLSSLSGAGIASYVHGNRIGVLVKLNKNNLDLAKEIAMHIAATNPQAISADDLDKDVLAKEKEIYLAQASNSGKPENIIEKMVEGRMDKYIKEITLKGQAFVKDSDLTIEQLLNKHDVDIEAFIRYELGDGIEKEEVDFAAEVEAQVKNVK
jgi:elongation factor Ts